MMFTDINGQEGRRDDWSNVSIEDALKSFRASKAGLSEEEAANRLTIHGYNRLDRKKTAFSVYFFRLLKIFKDPIVIILLFSGIAIYAIGQMFDAIVIFVTLFINLCISFIQEGRTSKAFNLLQKSDQLYAQVRRGGKVLQIVSDEIVPGDILLFQSGGKIFADVRIILENNLLVNESILTGEWAPVQKQDINLVNQKNAIEQVNMAWKGTTVTSGAGEGLVVATGKHTMFGKISEHLYEHHAPTPLQKQITLIARLILIFVLFAVVLINAVALINGIPIYDAILISIAVAIAGIPSGLPAAITVVLAFGMRSILAHNGLVRNILAAETLGSTTWILTDKTGTLTQGIMKLSDILYIDSKESVKDETLTPFGRFVLLQAFLGTDGKCLEKEGLEDAEVGAEAGAGKAFVGTAIEQEFARSCQKFCKVPLHRENRVAYLSFNSMRRYSSSLSEIQSGGYVYAAVGAPEVILEEATTVYRDGKTQPLTSTDKRKLQDMLREEGEKGRRIMGIGINRNPNLEGVNLDALHTEEDLSFLEAKNQDVTFVAFLSLSDLVREDVPEAVTFIRNSHINITVVTGDNKYTALQIAKESGIINSNDPTNVCEGADLKKLTDDELFAKTKHVRIFARMLPEQKSRLLRVLMGRGEVVAMTGDGVNDAPSLYRASIGIAVASGTDVAKEASDLILLKNSFATITNTIIIGRNIIINLKKILIYLLSTSFSEVILVGAALLLTGILPITPIQILWANIIEEAFISFAFAFGKNDVGKNMVADSRNTNVRGVLTKNVKTAIVALAVSIGVFLVALFLALVHFTSLSVEQIQTVMFLAVSVDSMLLAFSLNRLDIGLFKLNIFNNRWLLIAIAISVVLLFFAFTVPWLKDILSIVDVPYFYLYTIFIISSVYHIAILEVLKRKLFLKANMYTG